MIDKSDWLTSYQESGVSTIIFNIPLGQPHIEVGFQDDFHGRSFGNLKFAMR